MRSPDRPSSSKMTDWTVAPLQKTLKDNDFCFTSVVLAITTANLWHRDASALYLLSHHIASTGAHGTEMPVPSPACFKQPQQSASTGAHGTGMPASSPACFKQPQQSASTGAHGTGMPASSPACFKQPQQSASTGASGTEMPAPSASCFQ